MKKILFVAVCVGLAISSCKKESDVQPEKVKVDKKVMDGEDGGGDTKTNGGWD